MPGEREPVGRAIDVLIWLANHPTDTWSVRQVAREMDAFPSTIHRIFQLFESRNLVSRTAEGRYAPGLELFRISQVFSQRLSPVPIARPHLERPVQPRVLWFPTPDGPALPLARFFLPAVHRVVLAQARTDRRIAALRVLEAIRLHAARRAAE